MCVGVAVGVDGIEDTLLGSGSPPTYPPSPPRLAPKAL